MDPRRRRRAGVGTRRARHHGGPRRRRRPGQHRHRDRDRRRDGHREPLGSRDAPDLHRHHAGRSRQPEGRDPTRAADDPAARRSRGRHAGVGRGQPGVHRGRASPGIPLAKRRRHASRGPPLSRQVLDRDGSSDRRQSRRARARASRARTRPRRGRDGAATAGRFPARHPSPRGPRAARYGGALPGPAGERQRSGDRGPELVRLPRRAGPLVRARQRRGDSDARQRERAGRAHQRPRPGP